MKVFFHIGYPRTGTTFLQANIFPFHSQINYLGPKHHFYGDQPEVKVYLKNDLLKKITNSFKFKNIYELKTSEIVQEMQKIIDINQFDQKKINLISTEKYLTYGFKSYKEIYLIKKYLSAKIENLDFQIFYLIRNQYDIIFSQFHHGNFLLKKQLGIDEFEKLIFSLDNIAETKKEVCEFFELYDYYKIYNELKEIFGEKNIKILEYENFKEDPQDFFSRLSKILNIKNSEINNLLNKHKLNALNQNQNQLIVENSITIFLGNLFKKLNLNKIIPKFLKRKIKIFLSTKILITKYDQNKLRAIVKSYYKNSNTNFKNQTGVKFLTT
tara:strand:+ start:3159 stop:4136 length:978 start_codon:yes stop_codon:yes gene_type:complete